MHPMSYTRHETLAKITVWLFLFFTLFGTSLPFTERITETRNIGTSNLFNQIVYSLLFILSIVSIINKKSLVLTLIVQEKYLTIFLTWCFLSIVWSEFKLISFKRFFQVMTSVLVLSSALLHIDSSKTIFNYLKFILSIYLITTLFSILLIPAAIDPVSGSFRGLEQQKNQLGQICLLSLTIWIYSFKSEKIAQKIFSFLMILASLGLLVGSHSATSQISFLIGLLFLLMYYLFMHFKKHGYGNVFIFYSFFFSFILIFTSYFYLTKLILALPEYIGKDATFTGRTELWHDLLILSKDHFFFGCGFSGFWVTINPELSALYRKYLFLPRNGHSGYIDMINEVGIIGLLLFLILLFDGLRKILKYSNNSQVFLIVVIALIVNFLETTIFSPGDAIGRMFIFAYLVLHTEILKTSNTKSLS